MDTDPVCPQYAERPRTHSIPLQDIQTAVPFQGLVGLAQVEEDGMEDRLPHGDGLLEYLILEGGCPCSFMRRREDRKSVSA